MSLPEQVNRRLVVMCALALMLALSAARPCRAADAPPGVKDGRPAAASDARPTSERKSGEGIKEAGDKSEMEKALSPATPPAKPAVLPKMNLIDLLLAGGWIMVPIGLMGLMSTTFAIERLIALRRSRVLPKRLSPELAELTRRSSEFDPREVYRLCQKYPSAAANVIRAMLLKIGRPAAEVESAVVAVRDREGTQLFNNVRWLYLSVSVAPMLGLLGTVWGMIEIFHKTANVAVQGNKTQLLAGGIYVALVATLSGLAVAISSAFMAHFFEARIQSLFHRIDGLVLSLQPLVERYEGRVQVRHKPASEDGERDGIALAAVARSDSKTAKQTREVKV